MIYDMNEYRQRRLGDRQDQLESVLDAILEHEGGNMPRKMDKVSKHTYRSPSADGPGIIGENEQETGITTETDGEDCVNYKPPAKLAKDSNI